MQDYVSLLSKYAIFEHLTEDELALFAKHMRSYVFDAGTLLFSKGDPLDALYIITDGTVSIFLPHEDGEEEFLVDVGPGEALGQMNLVDAQPRTASARAVTDVRTIMLKQANFFRALSKLPEEKIDQMRRISGELRLSYVDILKDLPVFSGWPDAVVRVLADSLQRVELDTDEVLFHEGDPGNALYMVDDGLVKIVTEDPDGQELFLNQLGPGEALGEMSLIDEEPRAATVIAAKPSVLLKLDGASFLRAIHEYPEVAREIMKLMSRRLRFTNVYIQQIIDLSTKIAEGEYFDAMHQINSSRSSVEGEASADQARIDALLSAFNELVEGVKEREETLKSQVRQLTIQIDHQRREEEVKTITDTDFFADLKASVQKMREEMDEDDY